MDDKFEELRRLLEQAHEPDEVDALIEQAEAELNEAKGEKVLYVPMAFEANVEGMSGEDIEAMKNFVIEEFKGMVSRFERFHNGLLGVDKTTAPDGEDE